MDNEYELGDLSEGEMEEEEEVVDVEELGITYIADFLIVKDISSVIDSCLSQVVLGKPFVKISDITYDLSLGIVKFTNEVDEVAYKMPHKIEQFRSLSNIKKAHKQSVCFRNDGDKKRGAGYVMETIFGFYKECLELGPEYKTNNDRGGSKSDEGVT
nr:retrotransposon Orf1 [Tanacetum cinerariifolium]